MAVTAGKEATSAREKLNEDSDDEDEFLEYSPCGTITKLRQQVSSVFLSIGVGFICFNYHLIMGCLHSPKIGW